MERIVVGVRRSSASARALRWAWERSRQLGAELCVVTAVAPPLPLGPIDTMPCLADPGQLRRVTRSWQEELIATVIGSDTMGVPVRRVVGVGAPLAVLRRAAGDAGLLVLGSSGHRWPLSLARRCRRAVACPVVAIDHDRPC